LYPLAFATGESGIAAADEMCSINDLETAQGDFPIMVAGPASTVRMSSEQDHFLTTKGECQRVDLLHDSTTFGPFAGAYVFEGGGVPPYPSAFTNEFSG
jgi:hypothetical protein